LILAVLAISLGFGTAQAGTLTQGGTLAGRVIAVETFGTGSSATVIPSAATSTAIYTMASAPSTDFMVYYTLGGGAKWGAALASGSLAYVATATGAATVALVAGGTTADSTAQFRVTVTAAMAATDTLTLTYKVANAQTLATIGNAVTLAIALSDTLGIVDTSASVNAFTSGQGTTETVTASSAAGTLYIDVATDRINFGGASADVLSATSVNLGTITIADTGTAFKSTGAAGAWAANTAPATITDATLVLTGNFAAALTAPGSVVLDPAAGAGGPYTATLTATTATFTLTGANVAALVAFGATPISYTTDGVTAIEETTPTVALTINWTDATYTDDSAAGTLRALANNGTTRYLYNIPSPDNTTAVAYVRIINTAATAGKIRGTLTLNDGTAYSGTLATSLAAGNTIVMSSSQVATALGATNWTGRARLTIIGEIDSMQVQGTVNLTTNGNTFSTNFSSVAP